MCFLPPRVRNIKIHPCCYIGYNSFILTIVYCSSYKYAKIYFLVNEHLECITFFALINSATVNILVYFSWHTRTRDLKGSMSRIVGSWHM